MRNNESIFHLVLFAAINLWLVNPCSADSQIKIRPVTFLVQDALTGNPLRNIVVNYLIIRRTANTSALWIFPPIEPLVENSIEVKKTSYTNERGEVHFDGAEVELRKYWFRSRVDSIDLEVFFINLEPADGPNIPRPFSDRRKDKYDFLFGDLPKMEYSISPNPKYKGYVLTNANITEAHGREQSNVTFEFRPLDLAEKRSFFSVKLTGRV